MADKGDTYYCSWKREANGTCVGWEIRNRKLRAEAASPLDLMEALGEIVGEHYDDHEAALNFDPPLSEEGDPTWFADGFVEIAWNASFKFRPSALTAYANGRCDRCGGGLGRRTDAPLIVDEITEATDGASSPGSNEPPPGYGMPGSLLALSEAFLNLLTDDERGTFDVRPVTWAGSRRRRFFEIIPRNMIRAGAVKGLDVDGWRCDRCNRRVCSQGSALGSGTKVICRQDLPLPVPSLFFVGDATDVNMFCTLQRWRSLAGNRSARKLTSNRLEVVGKEDLDDNPLLGTLDEIAEFRKRHGFKAKFRPSPKQ